MGEFPLSFPSVKDQFQIVDFLDRETTQIDALIARQKRLIAVLQEKRQALISHAVTKGLNPDAPMKDSGVEWLGEVPPHWELVRVGHISRVVRGQRLDLRETLSSLTATTCLGSQLARSPKTIRCILIALRRC